jgi:hypothetical protein
MSRSLLLGASSAGACGVLLVTACVIAPAVGRADDRSAVKPSGEQHGRPDEPQSPGVKINVSKETTRVLEPLDKDGYVDYLAALNRMGSDGVTADNNAEVLFLQAFGAPCFTGAQRERFFGLLGIKPLPAQGDYFRDLGPLNEKEQAEFEDLQHEPWKARQFPRFAEWLKSNERPLALVIAGTRRERCYIPWVLPSGKPLMFALLPTEQASASWARALALRAMLRLEEGNVAGARDDLYACHRLARLIGNSPCLIGALISAAIESLAFEGDVALIEHGKLGARDALAYQAKLRSLPPLPVVAEKFDRYERLVFLDSLKVMMRDRQFQPEASPALAADPNTISNRLFAYWDGALRVGNETYDEWSAAARLPVRQRQKAFERLEQKLKQGGAEVIGKDLFDKLTAGGGPDQMKIVADKFRSLVAGSLADPTNDNKPQGSIFKTATPAACGRQIGKLLVSLLMPAINGNCAAEDRARARHALEQVGFALVAYQADHRMYPAKLEALVPKYLGAVPQDPCTGEPLRYDRRGDGFLLYSKGTNGVDEGGRSFDSQPPGDDIVLQLPRKAQIEP